MNPGIFRAYDIRGIVGKDLDGSVAERIGRAYGTYVAVKGVRTVSVGRDGRLSSEELASSLIEGLCAAGLDVIDVGLCPTPLLYFSLFHLPVDGGIMVTGSHNPPDYNGFKICVGKETIHGEEIQKIRKVIEAGKFEEGKGKRISGEIIPDYLAHQRKSFQGLTGGPSLRVVVDAGNGTAATVAPSLLSDLGCDVIPLFCEIDGNFPNHFPDPTVPENLVSLIAKVRETSADFGVAYDGDADRIGIVDDQGAIVWGDQLMILFGREILKRTPGATFISEVKCSQVMYDDLRSKGGNPIMWKTGHSLIKSKMKETGAALAGEMSGHIFFADRYYGYDDAIYATCRLVEILKASGRRVSELLSDLPKTFATPEIRRECSEKKKFGIVEAAKERFAREFEIIDVDGVRILFKDGAWGLIRASNTQPVLVLRFEAKSEARLKEVQNFVEGELEKLER
ncbi:MAG: phosphomannomutase/phosphoglucomutase [Deltaproteobacteria bacterium]|nr:phosphomannomutase/phosphoglucomutase [Deltaproteobacteria bacterium]